MSERQRHESRNQHRGRALGTYVAGDWIVDAKRNLVSVFPQDWWNRADLDFGYQWVTRVARDPKTGKIVGEGIRIQPFVLDSSCRELEAA